MIDPKTVLTCKPILLYINFSTDLQVYYFQMYLALVVLGFLHGLVFLPVSSPLDNPFGDFFPALSLKKELPIFIFVYKEYHFRGLHIYYV